MKNWNLWSSEIELHSILEDKSKNIIKDEKINGVKLRLQKIDGLPPKELRKLVDKGKKDLGEGIVVVFANKDDKVGLAVGITDNLINKFRNNFLIQLHFNSNQKQNWHSIQLNELSYHLHNFCTFCVEYDRCRCKNTSRYYINDAF